MHLMVGCKSWGPDGYECLEVVQMGKVTKTKDDKEEAWDSYDNDEDNSNEEQRFFSSSQIIPAIILLSKFIFN